MEPVGTVSLTFTTGADTEEPEPDTLAVSLSAVVSVGPCLWMCSDQTASVERLVVDGSDQAVFGGHRSYRVGELVPLPEGEDTEIDLEGADVQWLRRDPEGRPQAGYLWLTGSHSRTRDRVDKDDTVEEALENLADTDRDPNRYLIARIPLVVDDDGVTELVQTWTDPDDGATTLVAAGFEGLLPLLEADPHVGPFVEVPGKDNGLDVEGLAVVPDRLYVGLRGPVLRGWAGVLELRFEPGADAGQLVLRPWEDGSPFRKHFLELGGLGTRDLHVDGDDVLLLCGPTMGLDGPVRVYRWVGGALPDAPAIVRGGDEILRRVAPDLPHGEGDDHAEGFTRLGDGDASRLLLVYDSPSEARHGEGSPTVLADLFPWPGCSVVG